MYHCMNVWRLPEYCYCYECHFLYNRSTYGPTRNVHKLFQALFPSLEGEGPGGKASETQPVLQVYTHDGRAIMVLWWADIKKFPSCLVISVHWVMRPDHQPPGHPPYTHTAAVSLISLSHTSMLSQSVWLGMVAGSTHSFKQYSPWLLLHDW